MAYHAVGSNANMIEQSSITEEEWSVLNGPRPYVTHFWHNISFYKGKQFHFFPCGSGSRYGWLLSLADSKNLYHCTNSYYKWLFDMDGSLRWRDHFFYRYRAPLI